jgi:poly(A) polymerase
VEQPPSSTRRRRLDHTLLLLEQLDRPTPTLALGALLHDVGTPPTFRVAERIRFDGHVEEGVRMAHEILARLRFSREQMEQVAALVANHIKFKDAPQMKESTLKRFIRMPSFEEHLELHRLDCLRLGWLDNYSSSSASGVNSPTSKSGLRPW